MNYLEAKTALMTKTPRVPFTLIAIEAAALVAIAGLLVMIFT
jgi:hypothetical protein